MDETSRRSHPRSTAAAEIYNASEERRWELVLPHREALVRLAKRMGAGSDAEDVVQEAMIATARYTDLDETRVLPFLIRLTGRRTTDQYRSHERRHALTRNVAVLLEPRSFEPDLLDRAEAVWLCKRLVETLPPDVMALVWRHYVAGVSWTDLATELGVPRDAAKQRVSRALRGARRRIDLSRD